MSYSFLFLVDMGGTFCLIPYVLRFYVLSIERCSSSYNEQFFELLLLSCQLETFSYDKVFGLPFAWIWNCCYKYPKVIIEPRCIFLNLTAYGLFQSFLG